MAVNMSDSYSSNSDLEPYSHFAYQASSQLDFTFYSPTHEGGSKEHPVPAAVFNAALPEDMPSLGLTGEEEPNLDDLLNLDEATTPKKRDRGERIVWTPEEDEYLRAAVQKYGDKTEKWAKIAACVPGRTNKNCRKRWFHSLDPKLKKGPWTEEEDHLLRTGVEMFKGQWSKIAERIPGRTDDQCAKRWREGLDPHIDRAAWTPEDDIILLQRFEEFGSQWQKIALAFPGRPGLHCRNRWRKIQRSFNHMKRVNKRRSQGSHDASVATETQRLQALLDAHLDDVDYSAADDMLFMQDAYFDDDFALEHCIVMDDDALETLTGDSKGDQAEASETEDDNKPYGCAIPDCTFQSSSPSLLYYHTKASHAGTKVEKPFRCMMPGCENRKRYKNINGLQYHVTHAKNSPGHMGPSHATTATTMTTTTTTDAAETSNKAQRTARQNTPNSHSRINTPHSNAPSPGKELRISLPATSSFDASMMSLSTPVTPAEVQLQLHQPGRHDHQPPHPFIQHLSHNAFNIPHNTSSMDGSVASSQTSSGASSPQIQRTLFRCPVLGCDQSYIQIHGLNAHMANSHGHREMTMTSNDTLYRPEALITPQRDHHTDFDMDMTDLTSATSSPMDANILLLENSLLQHQMRTNHSHMSMDITPTLNSPQENAAVYSVGASGSSSSIIAGNSGSGPPTFGMLDGKEFVFPNHLTNPLQDRMQFGTHINIGAREPVFLQPTPAPPHPLSLTPVQPSTTAAATTSGGYHIGSSLDFSTMANSAATATAAAPVLPTAAKTSKSSSTNRSSIKKFGCSAPGCQKSYASMSGLNSHMRNDHPGLRAASTSPRLSSSALRTPTLSTAASSSSSAAIFASSETLWSGPVEDKNEDTMDDKPYKCLVPGCGKGYTNINGLKNHLLQTHGSTPKTSTAA
ncbi:hypothetical protein EDD11_000186 [Mortierella claussenii]|nr:hypothetical protein EDD11_000186 [Mortierella claussenii]